MGPSRKKPRTKAPAVEESTSKSPPLLQPDVDSSSSISASKIPLPQTPSNGSSSNPLEDVPAPLKTKNKKVADIPKPVRAMISLPPPPTRPLIKVQQPSLNTKASWYGTWPRKSTASTQIARETILADKAPSASSSADLSRFDLGKSPSSSSRPPSMYLGKSKETLDVTMGGTLDNERVKASKALAEAPITNKITEETVPIKPIPVVDGSKDVLAKLPKQNDKKPLDELKVDQKESQRPATSSGWLGGWIGTSVVQASNIPEVPAEVAKSQEEPPIKEPEIVGTQQVSTAPSENTTTVEQPAAPSSWFGWSRAVPPAVEKIPEEQIPVTTKAPEEDIPMEDAPPQEPAKPAAGSSWAFWSTTDTTSTPAKAEEPKGELAIVGKPSEIRPEPAKTVAAKDSKLIKPSKRARPLSVEVEDSAPKTAPVVGPSKAPSQSPSIKSQPPNLLIPSVKSTYRLVENPSILQQIARLLLKGQQRPVKHVFLVKDPPRIKHALAIGIHGLFPAPLLRTVIGQPTGTSIKFANHAAEAIRRWTDANGSLDCEIEKVALEGEGKIADRVDNLWKLLLNWIDHVRKADFILIGCHSQGVPVAVMLVAKLIEFQVVSSARIGICAMAGVSLGPFSDYKSRLFSGSAGELFEFANPESDVSKRYEDSLRVAVKYGTRIVYCGSIDDQLVSMEVCLHDQVFH